MDVGTYVRVTKVADPWEGGDSDEDRQTYIGHVGIVVEVDKAGDHRYSEAMYLVRFPNPAKEHQTGQRWFEESALYAVSQPAIPITQNLFDECF